MKPTAPLLLVLALLLLPIAALAGGSGRHDRERPDLERLFAARGVEGCFVLLDRGVPLRVNPARAKTSFRPASTFKVVNALTALEAGVAPDASFTLRWDGVEREFPGWNQDLTLEQAFRASAVWYFVELGRLNGRERLGAAMRSLDYGNRDASGSDQFWLDGPLRISADGQARVMERLALGKTPFSARSLELLRSMMLLEQGPEQVLEQGPGNGGGNGGGSGPVNGVGARGGWKLYGKTGFAVHGGVPGDAADQTPVGWLVGWVERGGEVYPYALNLSPGPGDARTWRDLLPLRLELARELLAACGVLEFK